MQSKTLIPPEKFRPEGVSDEFSKSKRIKDRDGTESSQFYGIEGWEEPVLSENETHGQLKNNKEFVNFDDLCIDVVSPPFQTCNTDEIKKIFMDSQKNSELIEAKEKGSHVLPMASFDLLKKHGRKRLKLDGEKSDTGSMMSIEEIIELAAENFIQSISKSKELSMFSHPYPISMSVQDSKGVQLVQNLLFCAEKVGEKKYERARMLLEVCNRMSSCRGTPVERLVFYFTEALFEKVDRETGTISPKGLGKKILDPLETLSSTQTFIIALQQKHPLSQIAKFSGIQAVLDHVEKAKKVHIIDLRIMSGVQWVILMQALAAQPKYPVQHLKITAMGTTSKTIIEETGRRLMAFAESLNLKFSFHIVMVEDTLDIKRNLFELDANEVVAVYAAYSLKSMIQRADRLEHVIRVIKSINPYVMIVTEMEANCNSPTFIPRFVEALFFYGAFMDSMAECMKNDEKNRREAESICFSSSTRNVVATEGGERKVRYVSINVWRAFLKRFGLVETELSTSTVCEANLVRQSFPCWRFCTLGMNGKCLTIGWKGTPLITVSAWKFSFKEM